MGPQPRPVVLVPRYQASYGRYPELTDWAKADAASRYGFNDDSPADDYTDRGYGDRCMAIHGMPISPLPYNSFMQFFQTPDHVVIYSEAFGRWRIVPIETDHAIYEVACHEGNYAIANILRGARALDGTPDEPVHEPGKICWDCESVVPVR